MFDVDYDRQILEAKQLIENLEEKKAEQQARNEGVAAFDQAIHSIFKEYGLTERDLFLIKSSPIVQWVQATAEQEKKPSFYLDLKAHFRKELEKEIKGELKQQKPASKKKNAVAKPTLAIGVYRNPITEEVIEKKRRSPKTLDLWLEEFGYDTVKDWKQD